MIVSPKPCVGCKAQCGRRDRIRLTGSLQHSSLSATRSSTADSLADLSRHRRRRIHRLPPRRSTASGAAQRVRVVDSLDHRQARTTSRSSPASSSSRAILPISTSRARAVDGMDVRAAPGGDPVGAALGGRSGRVESRQRRRHAERAGRRARRRRQARRLRRLVVGVRRHADAAQARRRCRPTRCRPTRCRSWSASSTASCSRGSTGSRP